jgi:glycine/D-amino acid oxidase-like deaminating enzyme
VSTPTRRRAGNGASFVVGRLWLDELGADDQVVLERQGPGELHPAPDVLVVGGGVMGILAATAFAEAGAGSVALVESSPQLGSGATGGALGLLTPEPHSGVDAEALVELGRVSLREWRRLDAGAEGGLGLVDLRWVALLGDGDPAPASPLARQLSAGELAQDVPWLQAGVERAVRIDGQARVNPLRAVSRLARRLDHVATGVAVTSVHVHRKVVRRVETSAGPVTPGTVVFATGGPPRVEGIEVGIPDGVVKGHMVVTHPAPVDIGGTVEPLGTQLVDRRIVLGGTLDVGDRTTAVRPGLVSSMVAGLGHWHPGLVGIGAQRAWTCFRPHHPDGLPVIDRVPGIANAWFTSGHYRTGILMAPATAAVLVDWAASGSRPAMAEPFAATRFT